MATLIVNYSAPVGSVVRIGYKLVSSGDPYTYLTYYPTYNQSPYSIGGVSIGAYQVEVTTVCNNCNGPIYSDPVVVNAQVMG